MNRRKKFFLLDAVGEAIELVWLVEGMRLKDTLMEREKIVKHFRCSVCVYLWYWMELKGESKGMQFDAIRCNRLWQIGFSTIDNIRSNEVLSISKDRHRETETGEKWMLR